MPVVSHVAAGFGEFGEFGISRLASLSIGLTAGTYRNSVLENYAFFSLLELYAALLPDLYFWSKSCVLYSNFYGKLHAIY